MHRLTAHRVPVALEMHQLGKGIALRGGETEPDGTHRFFNRAAVGAGDTAYRHRVVGGRSAPQAIFCTTGSLTAPCCSRVRGRTSSKSVFA
ncbi:hypothetical protein NVIRENTERO_01056 [Sodalis praecaptivus]|nr:hypothetical protein NVIRENTERO_01056 [Sodalis praecaptivus]